MSLKDVRQFLGNRNIVSVMVAQIITMFMAWLWWPYRSLYILALGALLMMEMMGGMIFQLPGGILADR